MEKPNIQLLHNFVLVSINKVETSSGGIILTQATQEKTNLATVASIGSGRTLQNGTREIFDIKLGDVVMIGQGSGSDVKVDGETYRLITTDNIIGILGKE